MVPVAAGGASTLQPGLPGVGAGVSGPRSPRTGETPCPPLPPLSLRAGFLCLRSENVLVFALGVTILGLCHYTLTVKGSHLAIHGALTESKRWSKIWALFFVEVSLGGGRGGCGTLWATTLFWARSVCTAVCAHMGRELQQLVCGSKCAACTTVCVCVCECARPQAIGRVLALGGREPCEECTSVYLG